MENEAKQPFPQVQLHLPIIASESLRIATEQAQHDDRIFDVLRDHNEALHAHIINRLVTAFPDIHEREKARILLGEVLYALSRQYMIATLNRTLTANTSTK